MRDVAHVRGKVEPLHMRAGGASGDIVAVITQTDDETIYAYDVYSNQILTLTSQERIILECLGRGESSPVIVNRIATRLPDIDAAAALASFRQRAKSMDVFQPVPRRTLVPFDASLAELKHQLGHHLTGLTLEVTERCNLRCKYCVFSGNYDGKRAHGDARMTLADAKEAVAFYVERSSHTQDGLRFGFYGGEPLLELDLLEGIIDYIKEVSGDRAFMLHVTTNGLALRKREVRRFLIRNAVSTTVSLDGPAEIHDARRVTLSGKATHRLIEEGLKRLLEDDPTFYAANVFFNAVIDAPHCVESIAKYFAANPLFRASSKTVRMSLLDAVGLKALEGPSFSYRETRRTKNRAQQEDCGTVVIDRFELNPCTRTFVENRRTGDDPLDGLDQLLGTELAMFAQRVTGPVPKEMRPKGYCLPGQRKLFVTVDGVLGMCEKVGSVVPIGTVADGFDFERIRQFLVEFTSLWSSACSRCTAQRICGMCPVQACSPDGSCDKVIFRGNCESTRNKCSATLRVFLELATSNPAYLQHLETMTLS